MEAWVDSEEYLQVMHACRSNDRNTLNRIIEERLALVEGPERAFWLRVRASQRARDALLPHLLDTAWTDLEESLRLAPEDQILTLDAAFGLSVAGERVDRLVQVLQVLRRQRRLLSAAPFFWQNTGLLNMKRRRWRKATRAFDRAIEAYYDLSEYEQMLYACRPVHFHAWRAICHVGCRHTELAAQDVEAAFTLAEGHPPQNINHTVLGMARAEVALQQGLLQEARSALQHGLMQDALWKRPKAAPAQTAETELLAARIARAEENQVGFAHFCEKALAITLSYKLPFTQARIQAVIAGAER